MGPNLWWVFLSVHQKEETAPTRNFLFTFSSFFFFSLFQCIYSRNFFYLHKHLFSSQWYSPSASGLLLHMDYSTRQAIDHRLKIQKRKKKWKNEKSEATWVDIRVDSSMHTCKVYWHFYGMIMFCLFDNGKRKGCGTKSIDLITDSSSVLSLMTIPFLKPKLHS